MSECLNEWLNGPRITNLAQCFGRPILHMDMGVVQPTQTMFFYWAESSVAAELTRMVNESTAQGVRQHPEFGEIEEI